MSKCGICGTPTSTAALHQCAGVASLSNLPAVTYVAVCTCGQRCPIHDPPARVTTFIWPPCSGCGSSEVGAHWPNCPNATTGSRVIGAEEPR